MSDYFSMYFVFNFPILVFCLVQVRIPSCCIVHHSYDANSLASDVYQLSNQILAVDG